jgi:KUP system potassium uptake protein
MIVWFVVLAAMGIGAIVRRPDVLGAVNPLYAVNFFLQNKIHAFITLSSVFLVLTGGEALYADMGHFGKKPIQRTWFVLVLPSLLLNYFGQGAYLLGHPDNLSNIFYRLVPSWGLVPLVILATMATIIASQAIISGVFSLSRQAMQLDILPRLEIVHTSSEQEGQIYVPVMNWLLCIGVILLILGFKSSSRIANAYGVAVSMDMLFTTLMILPVMIHVWKWNKGVAYVTVLVFAFLNGAFFVSTLYKVPHGGWITLAVAGLAYVVIVVWKKGRQRIKSVFTAENIPEELFIQDVRLSHPVRVEGTAVFFTGNQNAVPKSLLHNFKHNRVLHERVIFLTVKTEHVPFVEMQDKLDIRPLGEGFYRIIARYGFSEIPDIPRMLESIQHQELRFETTNTTFFLGRISIVPAERSAIPLWQRVIFMFLSRNADDMWKYYRIPPNRVIEVGAQIEL